VANGTGMANPSYQITFTSNGGQNLIIPNFQLSVKSAPGTATAGEVDTLTFPTRNDFANSLSSLPNFIGIDSANFVGSIDNPLRANASTFSFIPLISSPSFKFGDAPVDGLIAALNLTAYKNFFPEAFVTADASGNAKLVDNLTS
jgi:hypothetical protein